MKHVFEGKTITIPDAEIEKLMNSLELTEAQAIELFLADNDVIEDEVQAELTAKAKTAGAGLHATEGKATRKKAERKPDLVKGEIVQFLNDILRDIEKGNTEAGFLPKGVTILNDERMIAFAVGDENFEITLTKKRKPKN